MNTPPRSLSSSSHVYFPQQGSHAVHALDTHGELRTAMIVNGDRLVLLKQGVLIAESNVLSSYVPPRLLAWSASASPASSTSYGPRASTTRTPLTRNGTAPKSVVVFHVSICVFSLFSFRVAVATDVGILLFELDDLTEAWRGASASNELLLGGGGGGAGKQNTHTTGGVGAQSVEALHGVRDGRGVNLPQASPPFSGSSLPDTASASTARNLRCQLIGIPPVIDQQLPAMAPLAKGAIAPLKFSNPLGMGGGGGGRGASSNTTAPSTSTFLIRVRHQLAHSSAIRHVEFASEDSLCVLSREEVVLLRVRRNAHDDEKRVNPLGLPSSSASPSPALRKDSDVVDGCVLWRTIGTYERVAVCPIHHHIALTLPGSTVVVFPCLSSLSTWQEEDSTRLVGPAGVTASLASSPYSATPAFSPTTHPSPQPGLSSLFSTSGAPTERQTSALRDEQRGPHGQTRGAAIRLSDRGLTTSLGVHIIRDMRWHRVATHTLLCVTCGHPEAPAEEATLVLFTVQSLPEMPVFTNVFTDASGQSEMAGDLHPPHRDGLVQLIPAGTIPLSECRAVPRSPSAVLPQSSYHGSHCQALAQTDRFTQLVPVFSRSSSASSLGNELTFLHVEGDGTVRTSSYRFGQQRHASFAKQRAEGHVAAGLIAPLLAAYGPLRAMDALPAWRSRTVEFGAPLSGTAQLFMNTRRFRFVATFATRVMAVVMADMTAMTHRVECFLTLGAYRVSSLLSFATPSARASVDGGDGTEILVAALLCVPDDLDVAADTCEDERACTEDAKENVSTAQPQTPEQATPSLAAQAKVQDVVPQAVALFAQRRSERGLLTQLLTIAALPAPDHDTTTTTQNAPNESLRLLRGCVTVDCVALSVSTQAAARSPTHHHRTTCRGDDCGDDDNEESDDRWLVILPPVTIESLGPTQSSVAAGVVNLPHAQPARLLRVPPAMCRSASSLNRNNSADSRVDCTSTELPAVYEADASLLKRVWPQLFATRCSNEPSNLLRRDQMTCCVAPRRQGNTTSAEFLSLTVMAAVLDGPRTVRVPLVDPETGHRRELLELKHMQLVNNDLVVGVRVSVMGDATAAALESQRQTQLLLFGLTTAQSVYQRPSTIPSTMTTASPPPSTPNTNASTPEESADVTHFLLEHTVNNVSAFFIGGRGEVVTVRQHNTGSRQGTATQTVLERWLRCFPTCASAEDTRANYRYVCDGTWLFSLAPTAANTVATAEPMPTPLTLTACDALRWCGVRPQRSMKNFEASQLLFATSARQYLQLHSVPFATGLAPQPELCTGASSALVSSYHPDAVMQLIGMARWDLVHTLLQQLASAIASTAQLSVDFSTLTDPATAKASSGGENDHGGGAESREPETVTDTTLVAACLARRLCASVMSKNLRDETVVSTLELAMPTVCPPPLFASSLEQTDEQEGSAATKTRFAEVFARQHLLTYLSEAIPQISIEGLSSGAQMGLLCIVEALNSVGVLSRNVDEAAARFFFLHHLSSLRRRLRLPETSSSSTAMMGGSWSASPAGGAGAATGVDTSSILFFEQGKTAARAVTTASYAWAALSDSQPVLVKSLFFSQADASGVTGGGVGGLTWEMVERSGAPYWLQSVQQLRLLAEHVARTQYQTTKAITECALMYCLAQKVTTLAALCKQQGNVRLQAFFLRDFSDELHREAASANAFAAVGKNMPLYGAAFFILAGDVRSASQVILQRANNPTLALFVLRTGTAASPPAAAGMTIGMGTGRGFSTLTAPSTASSSDTARAPATLKEDLYWYREARRLETSVGDVDTWEDVCLSWLECETSSQIGALQRLAQHPTGHPEVLSLLRYVREGGVAALAHRDEQVLPSTQEVVCLMRLARFCFTRRLLLQCGLHLREADTILTKLTTDEAQHCAAARVETSAQVAGAKPPAKLVDYSSGTLALNAFNDDDDDEPSLAAVAAAMAGPRAPPQVEAAVSQAPSGNLDKAAVSALQAELAYMLSQLERHTVFWRVSSSASSVASLDTHASSSPADAAKADTVLYALLASLFLATAAEECTMTKIQWCLSALLETLEPAMRACQYTPPCHEDTAAQGGAPTVHIHEAFVSVLHLSLTAVALRARHILLMYALLRTPTEMAALRRCVTRMDETDVNTAAVHPCVAFFVVLFHNMREELVEVVGALGSRDTERPSRARQHAHRPLDPLWLPAPVASTHDHGDDGASSPDALTPPELESAADESDGVGTHKSIFDTLMAAADAEEGRARQKPQGQLARGAADFDDDAAHADSRIGSGEERDDAHELTNAPHLNISDEELSSALFSLCALHQYWRVLRTFQHLMTPALHSAESPTSQRAAHASGNAKSEEVLNFATSTPGRADAHALIHPAVATTETADLYDEGNLGTTHPLAGWLLVCCAMNVTTLRFNALADELVARLMCADWSGSRRRPDVSVLTDPNGVLLEMELALQQASLTLCGALGSAAAEVTMARLEAQEAVLSCHPVTGDDEANASATVAGAMPYLFFSHTSLLPQAPESAVCPHRTPQQRHVERRKAALLCQVCAAHAEVLWQFPTGEGVAALTATAIPSWPLMQALKRASARHPTASALLAVLSGRPHRASAAAANTRHKVDSAPNDWPSATTANLGETVETVRGAASQLLQGFLSAYQGQSGGASLPPPAPAPTVSHTQGDAGSEVSAGAGTLWCAIKSSWLRRHHTHLSLRQLLLHLSLRIGSRPTTAGLGDQQGSSAPGRASASAASQPAHTLANLCDRLVLRTCHHGVFYVHYDKSSCDSLVWSNEAGTGVDYGVRELLAGDNEWPLEQQLPERSIATRAFSAGLAAVLAREAAAAAASGTSASHDGGRAGRTGGSECAWLRPRMGTAPMAAPSSHPHLPFFLANHRDGHIDLYPFASPECVACYACPRRQVAITRVSFSPNGYLFCAGLQDGSIAVWHFTAEALNAMPRHHFASVFAPYEVKSVFFAGERSSILCATGAVLEPHVPSFSLHNQNGQAGGEVLTNFRPAAAAAAATGGGGAGHPSSKAPPTVISPSISGYPSVTRTSTVLPGANASTAKTFATARRAVGELVLIDVGHDEGRVLVRCALPFLPEYATFITALDAVLCVSLEGFMALYHVRRAELTLIGGLPLRQILNVGMSSGVVVVTAVVASPYDGLVALGTSTGAAMILTVEQLLAATRRAKAHAEDYADEAFEYRVPSSAAEAGKSASPAGTRMTSSSRSKEPTTDEDLAQRAARYFAENPTSSALFDATVVSFTTATGAGARQRSAAEPGSTQTSTRTESVGQNNPALFPTCAVLDLQFTPSMLLAGLKDGKVMGIALISQGLRHAVTAFTP